MPLTVILFRAIKNLSFPGECRLFSLPDSRRLPQIQDGITPFSATEHVDLETGPKKGKPGQGEAGGTKIAFVPIFC